MAKRLENMVCIITGGTSGIGRACTEAFVREGAKVVFVGRREERGREIESQLRANGADVLYVKGDLQQIEDCENVVRACVEKYGTVDVLMNNAGFGTFKPMIEYDMVKDYEEVMNLNLRAYPDQRMSEGYGPQWEGKHYQSGFHRRYHRDADAGILCGVQRRCDSAHKNYSSGVFQEGNPRKYDFSGSYDHRAGRSGIGG